MSQKSKKNIAIVINTSWNIFNFRLGLLKALQERGYTIIAIAPKDEYSDKLEAMGFIYHNIRMNNKGTNPIEDMKLIYDLYKLYKELSPDVILHYTIKPNIYGTIAASLLKIKTINNIAGLGTLFTDHNIFTLIAKRLYRYSQARADRIFFQNRDDYQMFIEENLVDGSRCDILPGSGVDTKKFLPVEVIKQDNMFRFLLIARMLWDKGVGEYVEAARTLKQRYRNLEFQLLGFLDVENRSAVSKEQMQVWVDEGIVNYLGVSDDVQGVIAQADCIVLPSFYREGTPRTLLESASMAKPIITTDNVGCRDVVDDGINGFLCEMRNVNDLGKKMEIIVNLSEKERREMGERGREKILREFDETIVIGKYLEAIASLVYDR